jgi:hypothetical protein
LQDPDPHQVIATIHRDQEHERRHTRRRDDREHREDYPGCPEVTPFSPDSETADIAIYVNPSKIPRARTTSGTPA